MSSKEQIQNAQNQRLQARKEEAANKQFDYQNVVTPRTLKLIFIFVLGALLWNVNFQGLFSQQATQVLAIFISCIVAIILQPVPQGAAALIALGVAVISGTLSFTEAFSFYGTETPWLVLTAILLSQGLTKTPLGKRLAYLFVSKFGFNVYGLTYSLVFSELLLAPAIPSAVARSGGIIFPLLVLLSREALKSKSEDSSRDYIGSYLAFTLFHTTAVTSGMFLTSNHPNPLIAQFIQQQTGQVLTWTKWAAAASLPGLINLLVLPVVIRKLYPPKITSTKDAVTFAKTELKGLGPLNKNEVILSLTMLLTIYFWITGPSYGLGVFSAAMIGLTILLLTNVITWDDCLQTKGAWNTFIWYAALLSLASQLRTYGVISAFTTSISNFLATYSLSWPPLLFLVVVFYFYSHYFFASNVAHVSALFTAFLGLALGGGTPPLLAGLSLAMASSIQGSLTHYGMSHAPVYSASGYIKINEWLKLSLIISVINITLWVVVAIPWWKFLGVF